MKESSVQRKPWSRAMRDYRSSVRRGDTVAIERHGEVLMYVVPISQYQAMSEALRRQHSAMGALPSTNPEGCDEPGEDE